MSPLISDRRAAEDFARVVDGSQGDAADRYGDLTACVDYLRSQAVPAPRPEFVADLRSRLMAAADTALLPAEPRLAPVVPLRQAARRRERRIATAAAAFVIVGGTAGVAAAAERSLPGDPLYPIKRGIESARVSLQSSDAAKGQDLINQAGERLQEINSLIGNGDSTTQVTHTLASYQRSAADGADLLFVAYQRDGDTDVLANLRNALSQQATQLSALRRQAPPTAQSDFAAASALLADLDQQARVLCGNCGPDNGTPFTQMSSAPALTSLLTQPAQAAAADQLASQAKALAGKADQVASALPKAPPTTPGTTSTTITRGTGTLPGSPSPSLSSPDTALKGTVTTVTNGVTGLLDSVTTSSGGALAPVTDPATSSVTDPVTDAVTNLLTGP